MKRFKLFTILIIVLALWFIYRGEAMDSLQGKDLTTLAPTDIPNIFGPVTGCDGKYFQYDEVENILGCVPAPSAPDDSITRDKMDIATWSMPLDITPNFNDSSWTECYVKSSDNSLRCYIAGAEEIISCPNSWMTAQIDGSLNGTANEVEILNFVGFGLSGSGNTRTLTKQITGGLTTNIVGLSGAGFVVQSNNAVLTDGTLHLTAVYLNKGTTVTDITYYSGNVGTTTPANWWFALYDSSLNLLANSADQTTTAWGTNTVKTLAMTSPYNVTVSGMYYSGIMINSADSLATHKGISVPQGINALMVPIQSGNSTTGLTSTPPSVAAALTATIDILFTALK